MRARLQGALDPLNDAKGRAQQMVDATSNASLELLQAGAYLAVACFAARRQLVHAAAGRMAACALHAHARCAEELPASYNQFSLRAGHNAVGGAVVRKYLHRLSVSPAARARLCAGHCPHDERPVEWNAGLLRFVEARVLPAEAAAHAAGGGGSASSRSAGAAVQLQAASS